MSSFDDFLFLFLFQFDENIADRLAASTQNFEIFYTIINPFNPSLVPVLWPLYTWLTNLVMNDCKKPVADRVTS